MQRATSLPPVVGRVRLHVAAFDTRTRLASDDPAAFFQVHRRGAVATLLSLAAALLALVGALLLAPPRSRPAAASACDVLCGDAEVLRVLATRRVLGDGGDSKALVDSPLAADPGDVLAAWAARWPAGAEAAPLEELRAFASEMLLAPGSDSDPVVVSDYAVSPPALRALAAANASLHVFGMQLCDGFVQLARRTRASVKQQPQRFTLDWLPHTMVVPGGRCVEEPRDPPPHTACRPHRPPPHPPPFPRPASSRCTPGTPGGSSTACKFAACARRRAACC